MAGWEFRRIMSNAADGWPLGEVEQAGREGWEMVSVAVVDSLKNTGAGFASTIDGHAIYMRRERTMQHEAGAAPPDRALGRDDPPAEPASFDVVLVASGQEKIKVITAVRSLLGLGLKEAKVLVDSPPHVLLRRQTREHAYAAKGRLEQAGATVRLDVA